MHVAVSEAKAKLTDLVRRAEDGEDIVLTRHGQPAVRLTPVVSEASADELRSRRRAAIERAIEAARRREAQAGATAARSQDWLYGEDGLPT